MQEVFSQRRAYVSVKICGNLHLIGHLAAKNRTVVFSFGDGGLVLH